MFTARLSTLFFLSFMLQCLFTSAHAATGLEIDNPETVYLVYTIEPEDISQTMLAPIVDAHFTSAQIQLAARTDAQLFLRVEQLAGKYLLYLDFSRKVRYHAQGQCFSKDGFVWGRYVKDIDNIDDLKDDVAFLLDEFLETYTEVNGL
jgi:hypothetical protein